MSRSALQLRHISYHCEGGVNGSFCIVAIRDGSTKDRHNTVANVFVDVTTVIMDDAVDASEERLKSGMNLLRIGRPTQGRVTGEISEEDRYLPASWLGDCLFSRKVVRPCGFSLQSSNSVEQLTAMTDGNDAQLFEVLSR
jgi:hypothetical protein